MKKLYRFEKPRDYRCDTLKSKKFRASSPSEFNDLNDSRVIFDEESGSRFKAHKIKEALEVLYPREEVRENNFIFNSILSALEKILNVSGENIINSIFPDTNEDPSNILKIYPVFYQTELIREIVIKNSVITCFFSEEPTNALMWTHYGENHKGFCMEYDVDETLGNFHEIEYSSKLPKITIDEFLFCPAQAIYRALTTKAHEWAYEKEYRLIKLMPEKDIKEGGVYISFPNGVTPAKLILGPKFDWRQDADLSRREIENTAFSLGVKIYRTVLSNAKLEIKCIS